MGTELSTRLDVDAQLMGDLWKKDTAGTARWAERFFVLKDGFLLYYDKCGGLQAGGEQSTLHSAQRASSVQAASRGPVDIRHAPERCVDVWAAGT